MKQRNDQFKGIKFKQLLLALSSIGALSMSSVSHAALFDCASQPGYCIGVGDTVIFKYVGTTSSMGLFGTIEVVGDSIVATPTNFRAESLNGAGAVSVSDNGAIQVIAKSGYQIDGVNILERGDYRMSGAGTSVDVDGWADVWDWNDLWGPSVQQTLAISGDLTINDGAVHTWTGSTVFDLSGATWDGINYIGLQLQNNLLASSAAFGESAWIEKKLVGGGIDLSIVTTVIPVPAAVWLFGSGLIGLLAFARRKA